MTGRAVNRPTDEKVKERDVNNKLQLYGIYSAFANGKVPSNEQIDIAMNTALSSRAFKSPSGKLSEEGRKLVADLKDVIEQAKILLLSKNEGNLLQDFIWQTQMINGNNASTPNAPIGKDQAKQHGNEALQGLRTLGELIISNGQFRKLLSDASILLRDMAGDAAQKAANKVNPNEQQLKQIDEPASDNTWHDVPDMSTGNLKAQAKQAYNDNKPVSRSDLKEAAGDASAAAHPSGSRDPTATADLAARDQQRGTASGVDASSGLQAGMDKLQQRAGNNVSDDTKETAKAYNERTKNYLKDKMPEERRDQTIHRLKKMVVEIQGHRDYQQAIETLLNLAEQYAGHTKSLTNQAQGTVKEAHGDSNLRTAEADLKTLLERFANGTSSDDLFESFNQIYADADADPKLKNWFKRVDRYIRRVLQEQGYILQDASTEEWNQITDEGEYFINDRYKGHFDRIGDEFKFLGQQFDADPQNKRFGDAVQKLFLDLGNDENGKATFKPHLLRDLSDVIIPAIFENIRYVPVPRIEYSDPMIDAVVENLIIESDNLAPNVLEFSTDNYFRWGRKKIANSNKNKVMLAISGVQLDLRDVSFYVKKKQGFPSITDTGVCDIFMGGTGFSFKILAETSDKKDRLHFFKVSKVDVDVKNVNIKMKKSSHKLLFSIAKPILLKVLRPALQKILEAQIKIQAEKLDSLAWGVYQEAERVKAEAKRNPDPEHLDNMYQRYASAAQKKFTENKRKAEKATEDKKANIAITQHDSIFPNIKLPGGISTKATEYKDLAAKGDKWESPVFSIGSAKASTNIPKAGRVTRKPHGTATPNVNPSGVGKTSNADQSAYGASSMPAQPYGTSNTGYDGTTGGNNYATTGSNTYGTTGSNTYGTTGSNAYGTTGANAYGNSGYGNTGSSTLGSIPAPGYSTGAANLGNDMDRAFESNGNTNANANTGKLNGHTTLGTSNPVLTGSV